MCCAYVVSGVNYHFCVSNILHITDNYNKRGAIVCMDEEKILSMTNCTTTPFYLYFLKDIKDKINEIKKRFPNFSLLYSIKANPHPSIVKLFNEMDVGFDVASVNEVKLALAAGCISDRIYYSAPGKTKGHLQSACGKCCIIVDSINELHLINSIAASLESILKVGIRLNILNKQIYQSTHEIMCGGSSKFGISIEDFRAINKSLFPNLEVTGIHIYFGSQLLDANLIYNNFHIIAETALELKKDYNINFVNFGGGFGVPYEKKECCLDINQLSDLVITDTSIQELLSTSTLLNLELGRFLVAECGFFVSKVVDIKESYGKKYVIIDGGMNAFYRPIMTGDFHDVIQFGVKGNPEVVTLVGRLCTPIDKYYDDIVLSSVSVGDVIAFKNAGAYGFSMSLSNFISYDRPKEIIIGDAI